MGVSLEEKIKLFEEYNKTGEDLNGKTFFKGHPIGQWSIQIRNKVLNKDRIRLTEEQLQRLENLGILERKIGSTIDEKIDSLIEWVLKYPNATVVTEVKDEILREYAKTDDQYRKIVEEYKRMQGYYKYARSRKSRGKLKEEQSARLKEGNVGGVFGYSAKIEQTAEKYGIDEYEVYKLLSRYGTMEEFYKLYKSGKIEREDDKLLASSVISNIIDIDEKFDPNYDTLYRQIIQKKETDLGLYLYSSEKLKEAIAELKENEIEVIERRFGLKGDGEPQVLETVAIEFGVTRQRINEIENKAIRKLRETSRLMKYSYDFNKIKQIKFLTDEERGILSKIEKDIDGIRLKNKVDVTKCFEEFKSIMRKIMDRTNDIVFSLSQKKLGNGEITPIEQIGFSIRVCSCLKNSGIDSVEQLLNMTYEELLKVKNLPRKGFLQVIERLERYDLSLKETDEGMKNKLVMKILESRIKREANEAEIGVLKGTINGLQKE